MPNWNQVLIELGSSNKGAHDTVRHKYLKKLHAHTKRNVLVYYSGWLNKTAPANIDFGINDSDKTGFMTCTHSLDRSKGLDLILHTPGGSVAATESLIDYLRALYGTDVRAIVPQLAMSGGTLMALSCKEIVMGKQSSLGPVDPQFGGVPAQALVEEFNRAIAEVTANPHCLPIWQVILNKINPTAITNCLHAIDWSDDLLRKCVEGNMMLGEDPSVVAEVIAKVSNVFGKQATSKNHSRHITPDQAQGAGLKITMLEDDNSLQDLVLTLHHTLTHTLAQTAAFKVIENQNGVAYVAAIQQK